MNPAFIVVEVRGIELPSKQSDSWFESNPDHESCRFQSSPGHIADFYAGESSAQLLSRPPKRRASFFLSIENKKADSKKNCHAFASFLALHSAAHSVCYASLRSPRGSSTWCATRWPPGPLAYEYALRYAPGYC